MSITIDKDFQSLIPPLTAEEFAQLEANCVAEGIRDALVVWEQEDGNDILLDGHNRWNISVKHAGIPFRVERMKFPDRDAAELWIIRNQKGRRNLKPLDKIALAVHEEELIARQAAKKTGGRPKKEDEKLSKKSCEVSEGKTKSQIHRENRTDYKVAKEIGISEDTYRKGKAILNSGDKELIRQVREGQKSINQGFIDVKDKERKKIDLSARAHLEKAEERHEAIQDKKAVTIEEARQDKEDRKEIANAKVSEIRNAIKKIRMIGGGDFDFSIISRKTVGTDTVRLLTAEINDAVKTLTEIRTEIWR